MSIVPNPSGSRVTAGVDWAKDDHAICLVGDQGEVSSGSPWLTTRPG